MRTKKNKKKVWRGKRPYLHSRTVCVHEANKNRRWHLKKPQEDSKNFKRNCDTAGECERCFMIEVETSCKYRSLYVILMLENNAT
jgi:hypothetical protein